MDESFSQLPPHYSSSAVPRLKPKTESSLNLPLPNNQRGLALLIFVIAIAMIALAFIANGITSRLARLDRQNSTAAALAKAKEALIAYAVTFSETHQDNVPGYLPCPNTGFPEGNSAPTCGAKNVSSIGRLPWRSLSIEPLRDSSGECLWYVVSGTFKNSPQTDLMNWDNNGLLEIVSADGATLLAGSRPENRAVAAIIAPGPAIGGKPGRRLRMPQSAEEITSLRTTSIVARG